MPQNPELVWTCYVEGFFFLLKIIKKKVMGFVWVSRVYNWSDIILPQKVLVVPAQLAKLAVFIGSILHPPCSWCPWSVELSLLLHWSRGTLSFNFLFDCSLQLGFPPAVISSRDWNWKRAKPLKKQFFLLVCSDPAHSQSQVWAWGGDAS